MIATSLQKMTLEQTSTAKPKNVDTMGNIMSFQICLNDPIILTFIQNLSVASTYIDPNNACNSHDSLNSVSPNFLLPLPTSPSPSCSLCSSLIGLLSVSGIPQGASCLRAFIHTRSSFLL